MARTIDTAFNFSGGWSYAINGATVASAIYDALSYSVLVNYTNGSFVVVTNVPPPFPQWQYGTEAGILALVANG